MTLLRKNKLGGFMYHVLKTLKTIIQPFFVVFSTIVAAIVLFSSCSDFDKIVEPELEPEFALPLFSGTVSAERLLRHADTMGYIRYAPDGALLLVAQTLLYEGTQNDFTSFDSLLPQGFSQPLGNIALPPMFDSTTITLGAIADSIGGAIGNALRLANGTTNFFPAITPQELGKFPFARNSGIVSARLTDGTAIIQLRNGLPIPLTDIRLQVLDGTTLLEEIEVPLVPAFATETRTFSLAGKQISNNLSVHCTSIGTSGSSAPVLINLNDAIVLTFRGENLRAAQGRAIIPAQGVFSTQTTIFTMGNQGERLDSAVFSAGELAISFASDVQTPIELTVECNGLRRADGTTFRQDITIPEARTGNEGRFILRIPLADMQLQATRDDDSSYLPLQLTARLPAVGDTITFSATQQVRITPTFSGLNIRSAKGYVGRRAIPFSGNSIALDTFPELSFALQFIAPRFTLLSENSFGIPFQAQLQSLQAQYTDGSRQNLQGTILATPWRIRSGTTPQPALDTLVIDSANSNIVTMLRKPLRSLLYDINGFANPALGDTLNTFSEQSKFSLYLQAEVPLQLQGTLTYTDEVEISTSEIDTANIRSAVLRLVGINTFPLAFSVKLLLLDNSGVVLDSIDQDNAPLRIPAATSTTADTARAVFDIPFPNARINILRRVKRVRIISSVVTPQNGASPAIIRKQHSLAIKAGIAVGVTYP